MKRILPLFFILAPFISVFSQVKLDSGLVAYYPFNGNANDSSGHANNPVFNNATLTSDLYGNANSAYHFNGSNSYMQIHNSTSLNMTNKMSIALMVRPTGFYAGKCYNNALIMKGDDDYLAGNYYLRFTDISHGCDASASTANEQFFGAGAVATDPLVQLNKWYAIVWTYDGTTARIYVNGVLKNSTVTSITTFTNSYDLFLGHLNNAQYPYWFNGDLDEVRIYNRALNDQEATTLSTIPAPTITSFSPLSGGANSTIIITGTNLSGASAVTFGGVNAASFTVNSSTKITAKVGTGSSGAVKVTTPGGTASKSGFIFCVTPSVTISANTSAVICANTKVTFSAQATNGGTAPVYQWYKGSVAVGANSAVYIDSMLNNGDTITCVLTSNASPCVVAANVTSNALVFTVNPLLTPAVMISANPADAAVCLGGKVQFTSSVTNGGAGPGYTWFKNGTAVSVSSTYTDNTPSTGDSVNLVLTSNAACLTANNVTSNYFKERVDVPNPAIKIVANKDTTICANNKVIFTATVTPTYMWEKNGVVVGTNSNKYTDSTLKTNDKVQCLLVSSALACNGSPANIINSNVLRFKVNVPPAKPAAITGPAGVKANQTGIYFSTTAVAGVTYAWTLPSGAVIDSGQGGNQVKVTWGTVAGKVSVIAINGCGSSAAQTKTVNISTSLKAPVEGASLKKQAASAEDIRIAPNPASSVATLTFTATNAEKYVVTITDAGNKVVEVESGISVKGTNSIKLNTSAYAKGVYFITVAGRQYGQKTKQLVVGGH